jgi:flagellar motility protein MotE (MotC chaperone)
MVTKGLKESDVFEAIYFLEKQNVKPTAKAIRDRIGSGSMTTISKHLKNWPRLKSSYVDEISNIDLKQLLTGVDDKVISEYFQNELPQVTALALSHLSSERAANILSLMDKKEKSLIINKIENMSPVRCETTEILAMTIKTEIQSLIIIQDHQLGGKSFADSIKKRMAV